MGDDSNGSGAERERVIASFEALPGLVPAGSLLAHRGRFLSNCFSIHVGDVPLLVDIERGVVKSVSRGPFLLKPWLFSIRASAADWSGFLVPIPAPGWHDLMAMSKRGAARIEGDLQPFMANLQYVKDVLAAPRALALV